MDFHRIKNELDKVVNLELANPDISENELLEKIWNMGSKLAYEESNATQSAFLKDHTLDLKFSSCSTNSYYMAFNLGYIREKAFLAKVPSQALKNATAQGYKLLKTELKEGYEIEFPTETKKSYYYVR